MHAGYARRDLSGIGGQRRVKYGELTPLRQRGGGGNWASSLPTVRVADSLYLVSNGEEVDELQILPVRIRLRTEVITRT